MLYPPGGKYWAFDVNAQNGAEPAGQHGPQSVPRLAARNAGLTAAQMTSWVDWYVGALADTARWQANAVRDLGFTGYIQVVTPGIGVLNSKIPGLVAAQSAERHARRRRRLGQLYRKMVGIPNVVAHVSSVADGSKNNTGCSPADAGDRPGLPGPTNLVRRRLGGPDRRRVRLRQVRREPGPAGGRRSQAGVLSGPVRAGDDGRRDGSGQVLPASRACTGRTTTRSGTA